MGTPPGFTRFTQKYDEPGTKAGRHFARGTKRPAQKTVDQILTDQFAACVWLRPNEAHHFVVQGMIGEATFTVDQIPMLEEAIAAARELITMDDQSSVERTRPVCKGLAGNRWPS